jgi:type IV pilus assembly protein PilA
MRHRYEARMHAPSHRPSRGFTLIELMVVVAVIAVLATLAVPSMQGRLVRGQLVDAVKLADIAKAPVAAAWATTKTLPVDNAAAGLPASDKIVSTLVSAVAVESGAIQITFGNQANGAIRGKTLTLRPAVVEDAQVVPVSWVCGNSPVPAKMTAKGLNKTDVPLNFLPVNCR